MHSVDDDWILNTIMAEDYAVPFGFKRKQVYRSIGGQRLNQTYYPISETVGGVVEFEVMKLVRIKIA